MAQEPLRNLDQGTNQEPSVAQADNSQEPDQSPVSVDQNQDQAPSQDKPRLFTQEQVNAMMKEHRKSLQRENKELKEQLENLQNQFNQFQEMLKEAASEAGLEFTEEGFKDPNEDNYKTGAVPDSLDDYLEMMTPPKGVNPQLWKDFQSMRLAHTYQLENLKKIHEETEKTLQQLQKELEAERSIRKQAEERARNQEKERLLTEALTKARCLDITGGVRYFSPQVVWVEGRGWMYQPRGVEDPEDFVSIEEGVKREIPAYLVAPTARQGGAGSTGSQGFSESRLNELRQNVEQAARLVQINRGSSQALARYQKAKRELQEYLKEHNIQV